MAEKTEQQQQQPESGAEDAAQKKPKKRLESSYYSIVSRMAADGNMLIGQDIEVYPGKECPTFASPGTRAYDARDRRQAGEQFVLLCDRESVPRVTHIGSYKALKNPHILNLIDAGIVNWPAEGRQKFAFVFDKPVGKKILDSAEAQPYRVAEDRMIPAVIEPIVRLLAEFRNVELTHRAINAENIYMTGAEGLEHVILGECLSTAPSLCQHPLYEPPSRAAAQPSGRGPGSVTDDLYALGVCVAMMARGENLLRGKSPQQIIHEKIEEGSFVTVIGKERIPGGISEFLRGVLNDDETQRWDIEAVLTWLEGRRLSPKQPRVVLKAARPLTFHGQKFWDLRSLAQSFSENIAEAGAEVEKGQYDIWLKRNFEDKGLDARFARVWDKEKEASRERLVSCLCMAMDPMGPVRYKGLSILPDGFGTALAHATAKAEDTQLYGDLLQQQLFNAWVSQSFDDVPDAAGLLSMLEKCRSALTQKMPGYGIERILYMLNMEAACMSPALQNHFVLSPGGLLLALEEISRQAGRPESLLDRHMIAFISVREPKMIDPYFGYVNSHNRGQQVIGIVRVLAAIQRRFSVPAVPGVCSWLISLTAPMIDLLNDRDLREALTKQVNKMQGGGNLTALLDLVDDPLLIRDDATRFAWAQQEYASLVAEKSQIESYLKKRQFFGRAAGRQVAMLVSCALATTVIVGYIVLRLIKMI
jgi:hypothetical protein